MTSVNAYFSGEKLQCSLGILMGLISIGLALYFLLSVKTELYKGMAYPFLIIPVFLMIICVGVIWRTPRDIARVTHFVQQEQEKIRTDEIPRMKKVLRNFKVIKTVEMCLFLAGLVIFAYSAAKGTSMGKGIGLGLAIQSALVFGFDYFAHNRGKIYWDFLQDFTT